MTTENNNQTTAIAEEFQAHWEWVDANDETHVEPFLFPDYNGDLERYIERFITPDIDLDFPSETTPWYLEAVTSPPPFYENPKDLTGKVEFPVNDDLYYGEVEAKNADFADNGRNATFIPPNPSPRPRLNVLFFPTRAIQYAHMIAILDNDAIKVGQKITLKTNTPIIKDATLFFGIKESNELPLYVATKRPINNQIVEDWNLETGVSLCVLVDWRFFARNMYARKFPSKDNTPFWALEEHKKQQLESSTNETTSATTYRLGEKSPVDGILYDAFWTLFSSPFFTKEDWIKATTQSGLFHIGAIDSDSEITKRITIYKDLGAEEYAERIREKLGLGARHEIVWEDDQNEDVLHKLDRYYRIPLLIALDDYLINHYGAYLYRWDATKTNTIIGALLRDEENEYAPSPRYPAKVLFPFQDNKTRYSEIKELTDEQKQNNTPFFEPEYWKDTCLSNYYKELIAYEERKIELYEKSLNTGMLNGTGSLLTESIRTKINQDLEKSREALEEYQSLYEAFVSYNENFTERLVSEVNKDRRLSYTILAMTTITPETARTGEGLEYNDLKIEREYIKENPLEEDEFAVGNFVFNQGFVFPRNIYYTWEARKLNAYLECCLATLPQYSLYFGAKNKNGDVVFRTDYALYREQSNSLATINQPCLIAPREEKEKTASLNISVHAPKFTVKVNNKGGSSVSSGRYAEGVVIEDSDKLCDEVRYTIDPKIRIRLVQPEFFGCTIIGNPGFNQEYNFQSHYVDLNSEDFDIRSSIVSNPEYGHDYTTSFMLSNPMPAARMISSKGIKVGGAHTKNLEFKKPLVSKQKPYDDGTEIGFDKDLLTKEKVVAVRDDSKLLTHVSIDKKTGESSSEEARAAVINRITKIEFKHQTRDIAGGDNTAPFSPPAGFTDTGIYWLTESAFRLRWDSQQQTYVIDRTTTQNKIYFKITEETEYVIGISEVPTKEVVVFTPEVLDEQTTA